MAKDRQEELVADPQIVVLEYILAEYVERFGLIKSADKYFKAPAKSRHQAIDERGLTVLPAEAAGSLK